jgi:YVTN family beta-propeller protein
MRRTFIGSLCFLVIAFTFVACGGGSGGGGDVSLTSIAITPANPSIAIGATQQFTATGNYSDGSTKDLTASAMWLSSTIAVATINSTSGLATAIAEGTSTITASSTARTGSTTLTVTSGGGGGPGAFNLTLPEDGTASATITPSLWWNESSGATSYTVEIATSESFGATDFVNQGGLTETYFAVPGSAGLSVGVIYYWRVTAVNSGGSTVATNAPLWFSAPIPAGSNASYVAVTPDGAEALVTNNMNPGTVSVVSLTTHAVTSTIPVGMWPAGIAVTPDGSKAVVANSVGTKTVSVIDIASKTETRRCNTLSAGDTLYDIAVTPDNSTAIFAGFAADNVTWGLDIMDLTSVACAGSITHFTITVDEGPYSVAITPDGNSVLTTNGQLGTTVQRADLNPLPPHNLQTISSTSSTFGIAITPDGTTALVAPGEGNTVKIISLATNTVTGTIDFASNPQFHNIAITPDGIRAVVVGDFEVGILSLIDNTVLARYPVTGINVAVTPDSSTALVTSTLGLKVVRIP